MLNDWQLLGLVTAAYIVGQEILVSGPRRKRAKERLKNPTPVNKAASFPKIPKPDFYGVKAAEADPESFHRNVQDLQRKLEMGLEVPVDATKAFYLMRNIQHHDLIVGETGTLNMNVLGGDSRSVTLDEDRIEAIMNFKPDGKEIQITKRKTLPGYIHESIPLKCGGVRWIFKDWHANECGMPGLCFDKNGRPKAKKIMEVVKTETPLLSGVSRANFQELARLLLILEASRFYTERTLK